MTMSEPREYFLATQGEAVVGWRAWQLRERVVELPQPAGSHGVNYWIRSLWDYCSVADEWLPSRAPHARCRRPRNRHAPGQVPHPECACGYSAHRSLDDLVWDLCGRRRIDGPIVLGQVDLWGRVLTWPALRAEFAYPRSFYVVSDRWDWKQAGFIALELEIYGVTAHVVPWQELRRLAA
jgi:hypothetical protein